MNESWTNSKQVMNESWKKLNIHEQFVKYSWRGYKSWTSIEQVINKLWTSHEQVMRKSWRRHKKVMNILS